MGAESRASELPRESRELGALRPEQAVALLGTPDLGWALGAAEEWTLGWGVAREVVATQAAEVPAALEEAFSGGPWFGGIAFDVSLSPDGAWAGWPVSRWFQPRLLIESKRGKATLTVVGGEARELGQALLARDEHPVRETSRNTPTAVAAPSEDWLRLHAEALAACGEHLQKVVIARESIAAGRFDPTRAFFAAASAFPSCRGFLLKNGDSTFVGATPETLCRVEGERIDTDALAGTAAPGNGEALLKSDKDLREHRFVVDDIREALEPWTTSFSAAPAPELVQLPNAVHLRTRISARIRSSAAGVVLALHPTAAVNGRPRERARRFIADHERLARGWYAGVVGRIDDGRAELRVALRSGLITATEARLFAGVGVVPGSNAVDEWAETERKLAAMRGALGGAR